MSVTEKTLASRHREALAALPAHGVWSPTLMPLDADLSIDAERFVAHARWLLERGCHGLALFGTTSEANSFSVDERMALLDAVIDAGIAPRRLMVGTGCCALTDSIRLTRHAARHGCERVLMLPPFYYKGVSDDGLAASFTAIIEAVADPQLRVFLYNFPKLTGVPITMGLLERLIERFPETTAGVKDSSGDWNNTAQMLERFPTLAIFPGSETFLLRGLRAGAAGCITATGNANPRAIRGVFDAWVAEDERLESLDERMRGVRRTIETAPMIPALKFLTAHYRSDPAWSAVRPPLEALPGEHGERLIAELEAQGFGP